MAGQSVGAVYVDAIINNKGFNKQIGSTVKSAESSFSSSFGKIGKVIGAALSVAAVTQFAKSCVQAAAQAESAFMGLNSILTAQNKSFQEANKFIKEYTADGLVGMTSAVSAYKNLAARGYNTEQIESVMLALKDSAAFGRAAAYSYEDAIVSATEGLRQENSILVDNAGVTKNVAKMWEEYAASIGKTRDSLTQQEKIQAEVNGIMAETKFQMGDAARYADTFQGRMSRLTSTFSSIKTEIGNIIIPIANLFIPYIQAAANAVLNFVVRLKELLAFFGLEMKQIGGDSSGGIASGMDAATESANAAADAIGSTGTAATAAAKAVKRALAPYDELNKLTFASSGSGGSGGSGGAGGGSAAIPTDSTNFEIAKTENAIEEMAKSGSKWLAILAAGFTDAFGQTDFSGIIAHIKSIGSTIKEVFTDPGVVNAASGFVDSLIYFFGSAGGAVARLGVNLAEWLVGSVDYALDATKDDLKTRFVGIFDGLASAFDSAAQILQIIGEISDVLASPEAKRLGGELLACMIISTTAVWQFAVDLVSSILAQIEKVLANNKEKIKVTLTDLFEFGGDIVQPIREMWQGVADTWDSIYAEYIKPGFDKFGNGFSDFVGGFLEVWNKNGKPILDAIATQWDSLVNGSLAPLIETLLGNVGKLIEFWGTLWEAVGGDAGQVAGTLAVNILTSVQVAVEAFVHIVGSAADFLTGFFQVIGGAIETFTGAVNGMIKGDWTKVGDGLLSIAEGIGNMIDAILRFVGVDFDITEWVKSGASVIDGLKDGIVQAVSTVGNWMKTKVFDPIVNAFKKLFGINSPSTVFLEFGKDILQGLINGLIAMKDKIVAQWNTVKGWFSDIKKTASVAVKQKWSDIKDDWSNLTKNIKSITASMKAKVGTKWNDIKEAWTGITKNIKSLTATMKAKIGTKWNDLKNSWTNITKNIKNKTASMKAKIGTTWSSLRTTWNNLMANFKDKTVTVTLKLKSIVSDLKSWVNTNIIKKINKALPLISIPYLAHGGWLPANSPQLAVVGDNRREGEIVAPESKIREQVKAAIAEAGMGGGTATIRLEIAMPDGRKLIKEINRAQMQEGKVLLLT